MGLHLAATRGRFDRKGLEHHECFGLEAGSHTSEENTGIYDIFYVPCRKKRFWNWSAELPLKNPSQSDTCLVASGSEKRWLSLHQVSNPFPASFWRTRSLADPVHKLARK